MKNYLSLIVLLVLFTRCEVRESNAIDPCDELDQVDLQMLNLVDSIKSLHSDEPVFQERLKMTQVYWQQYRDRHLRALYPEDWDRVYRKEHGREVFNTCICKEVARMTKLRIKELNMFLIGGPIDQGECPSSWNM